MPIAEIPNAVCAAPKCGHELVITNDGTHPTRRVPGSPTGLVFCNHEHAARWDGHHCAWCGSTGLLGALIEEPTGEKHRFCNRGCSDAYDQWLAQKETAAEGEK